MPAIPVEAEQLSGSDENTEKRSVVDLQNLAEELLEKMLREIEIENERLGFS